MNGFKRNRLRHVINNAWWKQVEMTMSHGLKERHSCLCCHFARQDFKVLSFDSADGQKEKWGDERSMTSVRNWTMMSLGYTKHYVPWKLYTNFTEEKKNKSLISKPFLQKEVLIYTVDRSVFECWIKKFLLQIVKEREKEKATNKNGINSHTYDDA